MANRTTTIDNSWYVRPDKIKVREGAGGLVVRIDESNTPVVALAREKGYEDCVIPKGGIDPGESPEEAARREIVEEAGATGLTLIEKLGIEERLAFSKKRWSVIHYFLFTTDNADLTPTDVNKHDEAEWFPVDDLPPMFWPEQKSLIQNNRSRILQALGMDS